MSISKTTLTGAAGEHYLMFRLLGLGYIAGLAPAGAPNADIIVTNVETKRSVAIQVKTRLQKGSDSGWHMKEKHEELKEDNLFYCFLDLPDEVSIPPTVYVLPSKVVAEVLRDTHQVWLKTPGKKGQKHNPTNMRRLLPDYSKTIKVDHPTIKKYSAGWLNEYKENWKLLDLN